MPTPNLYADGQYQLFGDLPPELRSSTIDLLYVTDRKPAEREDGSLRYTHERSASLAYGSALVEIGHDLDWDTLVAASTTAKREGTKDKALGMAEWLLQSSPRLGRLKPEDLTEAQRQQLALIGRTDFIDVRLPSGAIGHSYYHSNPAASSDIILTLRYHAKPGSAERPLRQVAPNYYVLDDGAYPQVKAVEE